MKKIFVLLLPAVIVLVLAFPETAFQGASSGLLIWFQKLLPTLLPFMILSNLCILSNLMDAASEKMKRLGNPCPYLAMLFGITLGLPIGAKMAADFVRKGTITPSQGNILLCTCNHASPAFVGGYVLTQCLGMTRLMVPSYLILYGPPLLACLFLLRRTNAASSPAKKKASRFCFSFQILDASIMNGFEVITKLGGYLMIFGMVGAYLQMVPLHHPVALASAMGLLEITTGIHLLGRCALSKRVLYTAAMTFTALGGLCTFAQTCSVISGCGLNRKAYFLSKAMFAAVAAALSYALYPVW